MADPADALTIARWRLVLGRFADDQLPDAFAGQDGYARMERLLDQLYGREYGRRGLREHGAGDGASALTVPDWIREVRDLFPVDTCEVITRHALERYGMTEILTDAETLANLEPSYELLKLVLTFRGLMTGRALDVARRIVQKTVEELRRKLQSEVRPLLWGRVDRQRRTRFRSARNLDLRRTVRANLANWDRTRRKLLAHDLFFRARVQRHLPWHIILVVDCSGSMLDSVIHSAVMAGIFKALPTVKVSLLAFDTSVVDLSDQVEDPVQLLFSVQLGGGTNIAGAMATAASLVEQPSRTMVVLVTDFFENGSVLPLLTVIRRLRSAGARVLALAALDEKGGPMFDRQAAEACADAGAEVAAMTPRHLAEWVGRVLG